MKKMMKTYEKGEEDEEFDLPTLCLTSEQLPSIKKWEVGEEYEMKIKVRQTGLSEQNKDGLHADFKILEIKTL